MVDKLGKATGPQLKPNNRRGSAKPAPTVAEPAAPDVRRDDAVRRSSYGAKIARMKDEADQLTQELENMPSVEIVRDISDTLLSALGDLERRLTIVRLEVNHLGDQC